MPLYQSVLPTPSKTYYHIGLSSPFPLPGYRSYMPFSSILSSHSPPAFPLTPPACYPHPLQQTLSPHSCSLTVDLTQNPFQYLTDQPILVPDTPHWFVDGSSQKSSPFVARYVIIQEIFIIIMGPRQLKLHLCHLTPFLNRQNRELSPEL